MPGAFKAAFTWLTDKDNRSLIAFILVIIFALLFLKQCNDVSSLKAQLQEKDSQIARTESNYKASIDTIRQTYDKQTGTLTATISGYDLKLQELNDKYSDLFGGVQEMKKILKTQNPISTTENNYYITERITDVSVRSSGVDSLGDGKITIKGDTIFSPGNFRNLSGTIPYQVDFYNKGDSSPVKYSSLPYFAKFQPGASFFDLKQDMTVYTMLTRDKKTGQVSVVAKTNYPGVNFNVLRGATIEDDHTTHETLVNARKAWGAGFSVGIGALYCPVPGTKVPLLPGVYAGFGLNFTPKKLQFGK